jgi:hypothetical protein
MTADRIDYRAVVAELLAIWDASSELNEVTLRGDLAHRTTPVLIRGLTAHAVDSARAVLTLYQAKQPVAALPIVRLLMEDALTAAWLLADADAWRSFISDGSRQRAVALRKILSRGGGDSQAEIAERLKESEELVDNLGGPTNHNIEQRFRVLDGGDGGLYLMYRLASSFSHASPSIIDLYTGTDERTPLGVYYRGHAAHNTAAMWIGATAGNLLHALNVWDICQADHPDRDQLHAIADRLSLRTEFTVATSTPDA